MKITTKQHHPYSKMTLGRNTATIENKDIEIKADILCLYYETELTQEWREFIDSEEWGKTYCSYEIRKAGIYDREDTIIICTNSDGIIWLGKWLSDFLNNKISLTKS